MDLHAGYACACLFGECDGVGMRTSWFRSRDRAATQSAFAPSPPGYTGRHCEQQLEPCARNPCLNGALCLLEDGEDVCYCVPDYHGDRCQQQYDECRRGPG